MSPEVRPRTAQLVLKLFFKFSLMKNGHALWVMVNVLLIMIVYRLFITSEGAMARLAIICILSLLVANCSTVPDHKISEISLERQVYVLVTHKRYKRQACYTRVSNGTALDEVCTRGDFLRYSPNPSKKSHELTIPATVVAIFKEHGKEVFNAQ